MEKTTVLARMRVTVDFTVETKEFLRANDQAWFAQDDGAPFLGEFRGHWRQAMLDSLQPEIAVFFLELGLPEDRLPEIRVEEEYAGSWVMEAALTMFGTVGTVYTVLKGVSELPAIADGLSDLKNRLEKRVAPAMNRAVRGTLEGAMASSAEQVFSPPFEAAAPQLPDGDLVRVDLIIDARPLRALGPGVTKQHRIHLGVAVSRSAITVENLGEEPLQDLRLGLFQSRTEREQWSFADAASAVVPTLSAGQTLAKATAEFADLKGHRFDLSGGEAAFVDCWVQDRSGIYLFRFWIPEE